MSRLIISLACLATTAVAGLPYLDVKSEEVDSSEDGTFPGAKNTTCRCGWSNKVMSRIVNGAETAPHEFPFAGGLVYLGPNHRFCGAVLITPDHALTAAHCTWGLDVEEIGLLVGEHDVTDGMQWPTEIIPIEDKVEHESYVHGQYIFDISLVTLERPATFSQFVGPVCLPKKQLLFEGDYLKIIGWGALKWRGSASKVLRKANVRVVPLNQCRQVYKEVDQELPTQICTYSQTKGICQGDSGGPLVWLDPETNMYTLVGLSSFVTTCGDDKPSVYTAVGAFLDWIDQKIRDSKQSSVCTKV